MRKEIVLFSYRPAFSQKKKKIGQDQTTEISRKSKTHERFRILLNWLSSYDWFARWSCGGSISISQERWGRQGSVSGLLTMDT